MDIGAIHGQEIRPRKDALLTAHLWTVKELCQNCTLPKQKNILFYNVKVLDQGLAWVVSSRHQQDAGPKPFAFVLPAVLLVSPRID